MKAVLSVAKQVIKEIFRKKDFYVLLILLAALLMYASRLEFYNEARIVRYLREIGLSLIYIFTVALTVPLAARQIPSEKEGRTLAVALAKPISRPQWLGGKILGCAAAGIAGFLVFFVSFMLIVSLGSGGLSWAVALQTAYLFVLGLAVLTALTVFLSLHFTAGANIAITLLLYFGMVWYGEDLKAFGEGSFLKPVVDFMYYCLPHFEFFDMRQRLVHDWPAVPFSVTAWVTLYAALYIFVFASAAWLSFRKRRI